MENTNIQQIQRFITFVKAISEIPKDPTRMKAGCYCCSYSVENGNQKKIDDLFIEYFNGDKGKAYEAQTNFWRKEWESINLILESEKNFTQ